MLGPNLLRTGVVIRGSVAESSMNTGSPPRSCSRTGLPGSMVVPTMSPGSSRVEAVTISMPPSGVAWRMTPAAASARTRARSATVISASAAASPVSSAVVTAAAPSIQRSRCRAVSYSRALPIAMPAWVASSFSSCSSSSVNGPPSLSERWRVPNSWSSTRMGTPRESSAESSSASVPPSDGPAVQISTSPSSPGSATPSAAYRAPVSSAAPSTMCWSVTRSSRSVPTLRTASRRGGRRGTGSVIGGPSGAGDGNGSYGSL